MALRRRVFPVLRFGWLVDHGQQTCTLTLDAELCVAVFWRFCYFRQSGCLALTAPEFLPVCFARFRPMTLRRHAFA
jgi:hypothetical protein